MSSSLHQPTEGQTPNAPPRHLMPPGTAPSARPAARGGGSAPGSDRPRSSLARVEPLAAAAGGHSARHAGHAAAAARAAASFAAQSKAGRRPRLARARLVSASAAEDPAPALLSAFVSGAAGIRELAPLDFDLPPGLEACEPAEVRGLARDGVRLMVSYRDDNRVEHARFHELDRFLRAGDLLVINTSGTLPAALAVTRADGTPLELHLSTHLPGDVWSVELRAPGEHGTLPYREGTLAGAALALPGGASARLLAPYAADRASERLEAPRLWLATLALPEPLLPYLARHGFPIRYGYVREQWPLDYYQTVYATEPGSAEMPSAGRAFTPELIAQLVARGVQIAPLLLHTGVGSLEEHEPPYEEQYRVPAETARLVNAARAEGRRVIAVGTTVVRALETVTEPDGTVHAGEGWTWLVVTPQRGVRAVHGLLTGLHEPRASHLAMLEAIAGRAHLQVAYDAALRERYLWHEFGDLHLILP